LPFAFPLAFGLGLGWGLALPFAFPFALGSSKIFPSTLSTSFLHIVTSASLNKHVKKEQQATNMQT
jgi:hypothetical protein